ncbi:hypothetical protein WR25_16524 [Diploscapter pachys]|uniref:Uncharacterized protein n=1 Tax=Diploscapter pachys TaxID=2018661 RepID=A0A2A2KJ52_9BILA|nr:hypothetical protein WR25_16524 [Diploscapter pachys]
MAERPVAIPRYRAAAMAGARARYPAAQAVEQADEAAPKIPGATHRAPGHRGWLAPRRPAPPHGHVRAGSWRSSLVISNPLHQHSLQGAQLPFDTGVDDAARGFQSTTAACEPSITTDFQGARVGKLLENCIDTQADLAHLFGAHVQNQRLAWLNLRQRLARGGQRQLDVRVGPQHLAHRLVHHLTQLPVCLAIELCTAQTHAVQHRRLLDRGHFQPDLVPKPMLRLKYRIGLGIEFACTLTSAFDQGTGLEKALAPVSGHFQAKDTRQGALIVAQRPGRQHTGARQAQGQAPGKTGIGTTTGLQPERQPLQGQVHLQRAAWQRPLPAWWPWTDDQPPFLQAIAQALIAKGVAQARLVGSGEQSHDGLAMQQAAHSGQNTFECWLRIEGQPTQPFWYFKGFGQVQRRQQPTIDRAVPTPMRQGLNYLQQRLRTLSLVQHPQQCPDQRKQTQARTLHHLNRQQRRMPRPWSQLTSLGGRHQHHTDAFVVQAFDAVAQQLFHLPDVQVQRRVRRMLDEDRRRSRTGRRAQGVTRLRQDHMHPRHQHAIDFRQGARQFLGLHIGQPRVLLQWRRDQAVPGEYITHRGEHLPWIALALERGYRMADVGLADQDLHLAVLVLRLHRLDALGIQHREHFVGFALAEAQGTYWAFMRVSIFCVVRPTPLAISSTCRLVRIRAQWASINATGSPTPETRLACAPCLASACCWPNCAILCSTPSSRLPALLDSACSNSATWRKSTSGAARDCRSVTTRATSAMPLMCRSPL